MTSTPEATAPAVAEDTLSLISDLRKVDTPQPEEIEAPLATEPVKEEVKETPEAPPPEEGPELTEEEIEKQLEERRNALLREIAIDPQLTQQYVQQQSFVHGSSSVPPETQQVSEALPFNEEDFDFTNPQHVKALLAQQIQEVGGPLYEAVAQITQRYQEEEAAKQQQQLVQLAEHTNQKTVEFLDTYVPGFKNIAEKVSKGEAWSVQEEAIFNMAVNMESHYLQANPQAAYNLQARAQIAQAIGPVLKEKAKALGLTGQSAKPQITPEQKQQMSREMQVESSNAVPVATAGSFDKALKSGDTLSMIRELRRA